MTSVWHYEDSLVTIRGSWIEWIHADPFYEVAAILAAAACLGAAGLALRQPPIVVFLAVGVLVGPSVSGLIRSYDEVELFAHIGIALLLFFFIDLGARLEWSTVGSQAIPAAVFSLFVLIGNPLIVMAIMGYMGYRRRTGFLAGLAVAQISEFSLILAALGVSLGHIGSESMGLVTLVGVVTIFASTYMILYSAPLYRLLSEPLKVFERRLPHREAGTDLVGAGRAVDAIVMGLGSYGSRIVEQLQARGKTVVGVDFDPQQLQRWRDRGVLVLYGDGTDPELYERLPLERTAWLASTLRSPPTNLAVLRILRQRRFAGYVALTAAGPDEVETYRRHGAHGVLCPFRDAADEAADALSHAPQILPAIAGWPLTFDEVRLRSDAACVGQRLRDVPVRAAAGASVVAVLRGGRILYSPEAEFTLYPGDHVVVAGGPDEVRRALELLSEPAGGAGESAESFAMKEIVVEPGAETAGKTLGEIEFRQRYRATVVGILRNGEYRLTPGPDERLAAGDRLLVLGPSDSDLTLPPASVTLTVESEQ